MKTVSAAPGFDGELTKAEANVNVLLVEDHRDLRGAIRDLLVDEGYRVFEATGPDDALVVAQSLAEPIHLLMTDVVMPGMGGRELAAKLVAERPDMRVVYMSGYGADPGMRDDVRAGAVAFLPKPFRPEQLAKAIRDVLA